jgi:serine protease
MPVKVLSARGWGTMADVAEGIRWAADHGAQVINLSLVFDESQTASDIPPIITALRYARRSPAMAIGSIGRGPWKSRKDKSRK